jgi:hypothetical protein
MKTQRLTLIALAASFIIHPSFLLAQGSLTPPAAPGLTFKTLHQVEPRTPVSSATNITQSGSYYLTTNISVATGDAITISASGVTLDLNGFAISSTAPSATGTGILISGNRRNLTIKDGFIESGVTRSNGVFSGSGFANGISIASGQPVNVLVSRVSVAGVLVEGIDLGTGESTFVESCHARIVGGNGITAGMVRDCVVRECGTDGVIGISVENCSALVTGSGTGIKATSALNCHGTSFSGGKGVDAYSANNCRGIAFTNGVGISAFIATGCTGSSDSGNGIFASNAENCHAESSGATALFVLYTAHNCYGSGGGGGISAGVALNCYGISVGGTGVNAFTAQNCYGASSSYIGVDGDVVNNCYGRSGTSTGLRYTLIGAMCYGQRLNPPAANYVLGGGLAGPVNLP